MKFFHSYRVLALSAVAAALTVSNAAGQTTAWGGSGSFNVLSFDSNGVSDIGRHVWELGWFADGYTPTASNPTTWAANWNSVDVGSHRFFSDSTYNTTEAFTGEGTVIGKQMYMFVHNGGTADKSVWGPLMGTPAGEALLFTEGLLFPGNGLSESFDIADNPLDTADDNFTVIWGRVDRNMYLDSLWGGGNTVATPLPPNGGVIQGGGVFATLIPDSQETPYDDLNGVFENQTATWPIPEPSSAFLVICGASVALLRRRRIA